MPDDIDIDIDDLSRRMDGALAALRHEFSSLRTGRASASLVEPIQVDAYGQMTPDQPAWHRQRARAAHGHDQHLGQGHGRQGREGHPRIGLGINPQLNGTIIMLPIPELNEERRRELTRVAAQYAEHARVAVRNVRRDGMDQIKKAKTAGMAEDDQKMWHDEVQELTDKTIAAVDKALEAKQAEIMQV
jgi:ribosome recycling factor